MRVMSINDLNNDKMNDLVMIDETGTTVSVMYFDDSKLKYHDESMFSLPSGYVVDNIIPTSFH